MVTKDFTNIHIPLLNHLTNIEQAMELMKANGVDHIGAYIDDSYGYFALADIREHAKDQSLAEIVDLMHKVTVLSDSHVWESLYTLVHYNTCLLPVINKHGDFCGNILAKDIFKKLVNIFPIGNGGAILQIVLNYRDYSLTELSAIVESNNTKITLLAVTPIVDSDQVNVTFGIDKNDATEVMHALERHDYAIEAWFVNKSEIDHMLEERYSAFMKYINV